MLKITATCACKVTKQTGLKEVDYDVELFLASCGEELTSEELMERMPTRRKAMLEKSSWHRKIVTLFSLANQMSKAVEAYDPNMS